MNESLFIALGLKPDADAESAVIAGSKLSEVKQKVLAIAKTDDIVDALGIMQANALKAERYDAAEKKLALIEKERAEQDFDAAAKAGDAVGKFTPAMAKSEWAKELRAKGNEGVRELKSFLLNAPTLISRKPVVEDDDAAASIELTDKEIEVAKKFVGDDAMALKKRLEGLKAAKLEDIRARRVSKAG